MLNVLSKFRVKNHISCKCVIKKAKTVAKKSQLEHLKLQRQPQADATAWHQTC